MTPYRYEATGRNRRTLVALVVVWTLILAAIALLDASLILMALIALCTAPALYDLISGRSAGLALASDGLSWFAGRRAGDIAWDKIDHIRLDTRLDFSVRASAVLTSGRKVRVPLEATPPADTFETVLTDRGITVKRHHFSLLG
ncbi:hypothetical protein GCM10007385_26820 [Tateyamaria omphalii]|uniref:hypothetical protein n=1 Tax=Tateyamaria omphalii TaxID=299262 RepID=UPI00167C17A6|nr:hypothetical protein [Tateyamaria omphalii]GGX56685.1 hypothetical protein GCM10007385_26820 [Tateyamaria omphalii]